MATPFNARAPTFDADAIQATIQRALASAGLDTSTGPMHDVTETIRRAFAASSLPTAAPGFDAGSVVDVAAREVPARDSADGAAARKPPDVTAAPRPGSFEAHVFSNAAGSRTYKIHVPAPTTRGRSAQVADTRRALVVMLHGCTQSADDFAAGTQMNRLADEHGFLVVYPEQAAPANASKCWNWFQPHDQQRGRGEPSLIAGIVDQVMQTHGADPRRIYVAGLSAGAAMAVVLGQTYPELFAGVGAHSGLAYGSAHDIPSALSAMKGGRSGLPGLHKAAAAGMPHGQPLQAVPIIVFHGDRDHTVRQSNGERILQQARDAHGARAGETHLRATRHDGASAAGRRYSRSVHADSSGQTRIESWTLHGAGHAWSGGHASGSFTDSQGPDASAEMVRFFLALPPAGAA